MSRALARDRRDVADLLLARGASTAHINPNGVTLLATAAFNGEEDVVRAPPRSKAPIRPSRTRPARARSSMPPARARRSSTMLLDAGVDVNLAYAHDLTALMWAAGHANVVPVGDGLEIVELLVERGAEIDRADNRGRTALMIAAERATPRSQHGSWRGADPALRISEGKTAIDLAADAGVDAA